LSAAADAGRHAALSLRAAWLRLALGLLALVLVPLAAPQPPLFYWVVGGYLVFAALLQVMVWKQLWHQAGRVLLAGPADYAIVTFVIHLTGSAPSLLLLLYVLVGIMYALIVSWRMAVALSIFGATIYAGLLLAEHLGWLPFAPAPPAWMPTARPQVALRLASAILVALMSVGSVLVVGRLAAALRAREEELDRLSSHDPLTGLYNRRFLLERLGHELARVRRGQALSLVLMDLDGFKRVNDEHGHLHGDRLLEAIAAALLVTTRTTDVVARWGGDELVVLLPDTGLEAAELAAARLLACVREAGRPLTASAGVVSATATDDAEALLRRADANSYAAKRAGGDRLVASSGSS
jgi:diguanylate cyclase (GGDEF)-like protein